MSVETQLADLAKSHPSDDGIALMRLCLFDWAVCALAGQNEPLADILRGKGLAEGGAPQATVVGGGRLPNARAALINGAISHALDYDDTHFAHIGHTSVGIFPAALAVAEAEGASLLDALAAALVGSEAAVRVGQWLGRDHYQIGFHQTATAGAFGATLASARLMRLNAGQVVTALGLAASRAAGLKAQFGTMAKPLNAGLAAEAGVESSLWARAGLTATQTGMQAFGATHHGQANANAFDDMGTDWRMMKVSHKFHACCHGLHAMLEALATLGVAPETVARISVATHPRWLTVCNDPAPTTGLGVKFSFAMTAAMALADVNTADISAFGDATAADPALIRLRDKVQVVGDDTLSEMQSRVTVALTHGETLTAFHDLNAPLSPGARETRLRGKGRAVVGDQAEPLWQAVVGNSLSDLMAILGAGT